MARKKKVEQVKEEEVVPETVELGQIRLWTDSSHPQAGHFFMVTKIFLDIRCECTNIVGGKTYIAPSPEVLRYSKFAG